MRQISFVLLWLLILIMPWEDIFAIPGLTSFAKILGVLAFLLGLVGALFSGRSRFPLALVWVALFAAWCAASARWAFDPEMALSRAMTYVQLLAFVWLIGELVDNPKRQKSLLRAFVLGTAIMVANMYFGYVHAGVPLNTEAEVRYTAVGANQNGVALCCSMSILFAFYLITRRDKTGFELPNWFYWGFIVAAGLAVPLTGSRTGVLSAGVAGFMLLGGLRKLTWKSRLGLAVSVVLVAILVPLFVSGTIINRISQGTRSSSFVDRIKGWEVGLKDWTKTPLLGVGAGSYQDLMTQHGESANVAHNTFVGVLVESGLVGFVVYFSFWAIIIRRVMRLPKADRFFWLGAFAAYLPAMIAGSAEYEKLWWFLGAMVLCQAPQQGAAYARKQRIVSSAGQGPALPLLDHRP